MIVNRMYLIYIYGYIEPTCRIVLIKSQNKSLFKYHGIQIELPQYRVCFEILLFEIVIFLLRNYFIICLTIVKNTFPPEC